MAVLYPQKGKEKSCFLLCWEICFEHELELHKLRTSHFICREFVVCIGAGYMKNERVSLPKAIHVLHERITGRLLLHNSYPLGLKSKREKKTSKQTQVEKELPSYRTHEHSLLCSFTHPSRY